MRKIAGFLLLTWVILGTFQFLPAEDAGNELRVMTYNIHIGIGMDEKLDLERTAQTIMAEKPDLVALQEVDNKTERTHRVDQAAELSKLTGMHVAFGRTIDLTGGEYGIAILSKFPIESYRITQLPGGNNLEDRGVLEAKVKINDKTTILFCSTHFCHVSEARRTAQAEKINELFTESDLPVIIGGDFNAEPGSETVKTLKKQWTDATNSGPTWGNPNLRSKIDFIFYRPENMFKVKETKVVEAKVTSDHSPVLTVFKMEDEK